ncbi:MAG: DUF927 domain-containing protein [Magnetococcus sp. MYC-9]
MDDLRALVDRAIHGGDDAVLGEEAMTASSWIKRPSYRVYDEPIHGYRAGVYYHGQRQTKEGYEPVDEYVCGPLYVEAQLRTRQGGGFSRLLRFRDTCGIWKEYVMPMELLCDRCEELRAKLLALGLDIDFHNRNHLPTYLLHSVPGQMLELAQQVGWHGAHRFVLPDEVLGAPGVFYQGNQSMMAAYATMGTLEGWRDVVSSFCVGNPLMVFAVSVAFMGPLLAKIGMDGGGFHFYGDSSTGKTTALRAAASVWGGRAYWRSWRATGNGLEAAAASYNDTLLVLDEIGEVSPREAGAIVYALSNGQGKQRADRLGEAREVTRWQTVILSTGERTLATCMLDGRQEQRAGQEIRLLDVPVFRQHGVFDDLRGFRDGRAFSDHFRDAVTRYHGHAGRAFVRRLVADDVDLQSQLSDVYGRFLSLEGDSQERRAGKLFAVAGFAGELASHYGVTGWFPGVALEAARVVFTLWRTVRGEGNSEKRGIVARILDFIDAHGDARFSSLLGGDDKVVRDRAGWLRKREDALEYLFTAGGMKEALSGYDLRRALDVLEAEGLLRSAASGAREGRAISVRADGRVVKVYMIVPQPVHYAHMV